MLESVAHLVDAGFAVHWLRERSKAPVEKKWSSAPVYTQDQLRAAYRPGFNVGVRLGEPSRVYGLYLHVIDLDIRDAALADEARAALRALLPEVDTLPFVISGSGGESRHFYFATEKPFRSKKLAVSGGKQRRDRRDPETGEIKVAWSYDWEIELFGTGKQVAMPPSIHPDTGAEYAWGREIDLDLLEMGLGCVISADRIEALGVVEDQEFGFETREPLEFKDGQIEAELSTIQTSDLDYDDWIRLGQALHHQFGGSKEGFALWLKHTKRSAKYVGPSQDEEMRRVKWPSFGRYRGQAVTMATVRSWAQDARTARLIDEFDDEPLTDDDDLIGEAPKASFGDDLDEILGDASAPDAAPKAVDWHSLLDLNEEGAIKPTLHNIELLVRHDVRTTDLALLNEFNQEIVLRGEPGTLKRRRERAKAAKQLGGRMWQVQDPINGDLWASEHDDGIRSLFEAPKSQGGYGIRITDRDLRSAVNLVARERAFHPVREYLTGLRWDGRLRLEGLFTRYLGADDSAYTRSISRLTLLGAVVRVFEPGHKFDFVAIFEGLQGKRKSTFINILARNWFAELEGDFEDRKMMVEKMQGSWILELGELQQFNRSDVAAIKAFVSARVDKVRLAYDKRAREFPRQCIFIGSTNDSTYLRDDTGGRRFWPVTCRVAEIDTEGFEREVDQVWAEAVTIYREMRAQQPRGPLPLYIVDEGAKAEAAARQESRRIETAEDTMAGQIEAWLDRPVADEHGFEDVDLIDGAAPVRNEVCLLEIWREMLGRDTSSYGQGPQQLLGRAMKKVPGWYQIGRVRTEKYGQQRVFRRE